MSKRGRWIGVVLAPVVGVCGPLLSAAAVAAEMAQEGGEPLATAEPEVVDLATADIDEGEELLVLGSPSPDGYLVEVSAEATGWEPVPLAVLNTGPVDTRAWTGYHCLTGDGETVVAVVAPWEASNRPELRDRGAVAFGVDVRSGEITRLVDGVALKHFNPGCGEDSAAFVRHLGVDQASSEVLVVDADDGNVIEDVSLPGQVVGAVRSGGETYVLRDLAIAVLDGGDEVASQPTGGQPHMLAASPDGVTFLAADGDEALVRRVAGGDVATLGTYELGEVKLHEGLHGGVTAVVRGDDAGRSADGLEWLEVDAAAPLPEQVSSGATAVLEAAPVEDAAAASVESIATADGDVVFERDRPQIDMALPDEVLEYEVTAEDLAAAANFTTPVCAVPRNHPDKMAPQPTDPQVKWAIEQAVTRNTNFTRPVAYLNQNWASYKPSVEFPVGTLFGPTPEIPASVAWATFAQETNWAHASRRSLAGTSANPTVASYYGAPWDDPTSLINYDDADCGYGLAQVTDGMRNNDGLRTPEQELKIALDYYANASAGAKILVEKWNQLAGYGMLLNGGDARYLENWYFALWAYNSGVRTNAIGQFGLGWGNNPRNSDYPPDRLPFLRENLDDARTPADWPYQERVFGWMETPQWDPYSGDDKYPEPQGGGEIDFPGINTFCGPSNQCDPNYIDPNQSNGDQSYCTRADRNCWWNQPVTFSNCATAGVCAQSPPPNETNQEPAQGDEDWPPNCSGLPTGVSPDTPGLVVVDDVPTSTPNIEGCPPVLSRGTFTPTFGASATGAPLAEIDWHQLGTGYGGHTWFTDNVSPADTAHTVRARWTPNGSLMRGRFEVYAHIPPAGARSHYATYTIGNGFTTYKATVDQGWYEDRPDDSWALLGSFQFFGDGSYVELANANGEAPGDTTLAFDAVAFVPKGAGLPVSTTFIPRGAAWRYDDDGTLASGWASPDLDHHSWDNGHAPLGAQASGLRTTINRTSPNHVTDVFRRTFEVEDTADLWAMEIGVRFDDGIVVWINGVPVMRSNMEATTDPPDAGDPALVCRDAPAQDNYETTVVPALSLIEEGTNTIAVEVHQCAANSTDSVFDLSLVGVTSPPATDFQIDAGYSREGEDEVAGVDMSWAPVMAAYQYDVYQIDWLTGPDAVPVKIGEVTDTDDLDPRGRVTFKQTTIYERHVLREWYVIAHVMGGGVSPPSNAQRALFIPNATEEPDRSGPDIARTVPAPPAALPGKVPTTPVVPVPTQAPRMVPPSGPGVGWGAVIALAVIAGDYFLDDLFQGSETRLPDEVTTVPLVYMSSRQPTSGEIDALATQLQTRTTWANVPLTSTQYETIAEQCLKSRAVAVAGANVCTSADIFMPGENHREATNHYFDAIAAVPPWAILNRDVTGPVKAPVVPRGWYSTQPACLEAEEDEECDEFPFYVTSQNRGRNSAPPVSLRPVYGPHNRGVGTALSVFYGTGGCNIRQATAPLEPDGGRYVVLPMPSHVSSVDTTFFCAPPAK